MTLRRYSLRSLFAGAGAALVVFSLSAGAFAQGLCNTNRGVSVLVLDRSKPPETLNVPDNVKAGIEDVWLLSAKNGDPVF
ncbi:MAG: hypothetical protein ACLPT4_04400 [Verrucomicrobiia bacterium]